MKRILICGSNGLLGQHLAKLLCNDTEYEVLNTSHHRTFYLNNSLFDFTQLDVTNRSDLKSLASSFQPQIIINCSGLTNVDLCEKEREKSWKVNVVGVQNLVDCAKITNAKLIHISTDYVFDGHSGPYSETARPNPINYYGKSKLAGENAILSSDVNYVILRTIVLFGAGENVKYNFALWVANNLLQKNKINCVTDQISNPTYAADLAQACVLSMNDDVTGIFHIAGPTLLSRYEFAVKIAEVFNFDSSLITPLKTEDLKQIAHRPKNSGFILDKAKKVLNYKPTDLKKSILQLKLSLEKQSHLN